MWNGYGVGWAGGNGMLVLLALLIASVVLLTRWFTREPGCGQPLPPAQGAADTRRDVALDIARERFVRGEITVEKPKVIKRRLEP
ncbi:putative membrane protein [Deinococcus sp. UYEF24]